MRRFIAGIGLLVSGAFSLVAITLAAPLLWAMRKDREERNRVDALERVSYPYDDNDPGVDVDDNEDEIDLAHQQWHEWHGTACDDAPTCDDFERVRHER